MAYAADSIRSALKGIASKFGCLRGACNLMVFARDSLERSFAAYRALPSARNRGHNPHTTLADVSLILKI
jgi:hypothetical protein